MKEGQAKVLSERELSRVVNVAKKKAHAKRNVALLYCSFGLGLRAKEMAALRIKHVLGVDGQMSMSSHVMERNRNVNYVSPKKHLTYLEAYFWKKKGSLRGSQSYVTDRLLGCITGLSWIHYITTIFDCFKSGIAQASSDFLSQFSALLYQRVDIT